MADLHCRVVYRGVAIDAFEQRRARSVEKGHAEGGGDSPWGVLEGLHHGPIGEGPGGQASPSADGGGAAGNGSGSGDGSGAPASSVASLCRLAALETAQTNAGGAGGASGASGAGGAGTPPRPSWLAVSLELAARDADRSALLGAVELRELEEGGWHGPAPAAMPPIPAFKRMIERIYNDPSHLRQLSTRSHAAAAQYVSGRRHGLLRTLHSICDAPKDP